MSNGQPGGDPWGFEDANERALADVTRLQREDPARFHELLRLYNALLHEGQNGKSEGWVEVVPLSAIQPEQVRWLWNLRVPEGKLSLLAGDAGEGKTYLTCRMAADLSVGQALPQSAGGLPRRVLMWNGEDEPGDTIRPRIEKQDAFNLDLISVIRQTHSRDGKVRPFDLNDLPKLGQEMEAHPDTKLIVIDPITALLSAADIFRDNEVRAALMPLKEFAEQWNVAILLVMHLKKADAHTHNPIHAITGSTAFGAIPRSILLLGTHALSGRKSVDCRKHNLAQHDPSPVEFRIVDGKFEWLDFAPDLTFQAIRESHVQAQKPSSKRQNAKDFLLEILAGGPKLSTEIRDLGRERGIVWDTLYRVATQDLGIKPRKTSEWQGKFLWELPGATYAAQPPPSDEEEELVRIAMQDEHRW